MRSVARIESWTGGDYHHDPAKTCDQLIMLEKEETNPEGAEEVL